MYLQRLSKPAEEKVTISVFGGINRRSGASMSQFQDMKGISPFKYPSIGSGFQKWTMMDWDSDVSSFGHYKNAYYFADGRLCYNSVYTDLIVEGEVKSVVGFGNYLVIFPQKVWFNTDDLSFGSLENSKTLTSSLSLASADGVSYEGYTVSETQPVTASDGALWLDITGDTPVLKRYLNGSFYAVSDAFIKIEGEDVGSGFAVGDSVNLSSESLSGSFNVKAIGEGFICLGGCFTPNGKTEEIKVSRDIPDIDYAIEFGNRIWGCSKAGNEIFASELGKKDCFYTFEGTSADSYVVSLGENTPFLGVAELAGRLYFFKNQFIYMLWGTKPQNYQLSRVSENGLSSSAPNAVVKHKGYLYYYSNLGLMRFDGSSADRVDERLSLSYSEATLCSTGENLYMLAGKKELYCIDTDVGEIYKMDEGAYKAIYNVGQLLSYVDETEMGCYTKVRNTGQEFMLEFPPQGQKTDTQSFICKIGLGMYLGEKGKLSVHVAYDDGDFIEVKRIYGKARSFTVPLMLKRCSSFRLRLQGKGEFTLYSVSLYKSEVK